jgi:hypothetical protein
MKDMKELLRQRDVLLEELLKVPTWVNGSVVESVRKYQGKENPFYYLSQSVKGKNRITYVSAGQLEKFKAAAASGKKVKDLLYKLSVLNIRIIKAGCRQ